MLTGTCAGKGRAQIINRKINVKNRAAEAEQVEGRKKGGLAASTFKPATILLISLPWGSHESLIERLSPKERIVNKSSNFV